MKTTVLDANNIEIWRLISRKEWEAKANRDCKFPKHKTNILYVSIKKAMFIAVDQETGDVDTFVIEGKELPKLDAMEEAEILALLTPSFKRSEEFENDNLEDIYTQRLTKPDISETVEYIKMSRKANRLEDIKSLIFLIIFIIILGILALIVSLLMANS